MRFSNAYNVFPTEITKLDFSLVDKRRHCLHIHSKAWRNMGFLFILITLEDTYTILLQLINQSTPERSERMFHFLMASYATPTVPLIPILLNGSKEAGKNFFFPPSHTRFSEVKHWANKTALAVLKLWGPLI